MPDHSDLSNILEIANRLTRWVDATKKTGGTSDEVPGIEMLPVPGQRYKLGRFSTRNKDFHTHVSEIHGLIHDYAARPSASKPLNLLISAPPGSGKSFLVKQLLTREGSKGLGVPYLELNIANIASRSDLGAAWSFVRTMESNHITPCVFFDEIDAHVDGTYLLKDLIMPMYDAAVIHDGAKLPLGPAVFIFAGSKLFEAPTVVGTSKGGMVAKVKFSDWLIEREASIRALGSPPTPEGGSSKANAESGTVHTVPKVRDFLDRIDRCIIFPDSSVAFEGMDKEVMENEALDLVLSMIRRHFPHVLCVEVTAAAALAVALQDGSSKRAAERLIFTSITPPNDKLFRFTNLPSDARRLLPRNKITEIETKYKGKAFKIE